MNEMVSENLDEKEQLDLENKQIELQKREDVLKENEALLLIERKKWDATKEERNNKLIDEIEEKRTNLEGKLKEKEDETYRKLEKAEKESEEKIEISRSNLKKEEEELEEAKKKFKRERDAFERDKIRYETEQEQLSERENNLIQEVNDRVAVKERQYKEDLARKEAAISDLLRKREDLATEVEKYKTFEELYGNSPEKIKKDITSLNERINELNNKISSLPPKEIEIEYTALKTEYSQLMTKYSSKEQENANLKNQLLDSKREDLELKIRNLESDNVSLKNEVLILTKSNEDLQGKLKRLVKPEMLEEQKQARLDEISKLAFFNNDKVVYRFRNDENEIEWLDDIYQRCEKFKFHFNKRILYAFHTALKISDWSIITVLAGVSGTGKSKLPELYSAFGGINFINIPVQPSWDSQESMLGYFNSIDNRFQAEPLLKFLIQCTETKPYNDCMSIVLLDEMNLAHIEHYFADFLSKLEERRIKDKNNLPKIEIKLGAQCPSHYLDLVRSILWVGTMNQDETTKSLSDKVIDRGLIINFPRPDTLVTMSKNETISKLINYQLVNGIEKPLAEIKKDEKAEGPIYQRMIPKTNWMKWVVRDISETSEDIKKQMDKYKSVVQGINEALEPIGRAMGHRVWQSIEYYIYNYPTVRASLSNNKDGSLSEDLRKEMQIAFEDQVVQKVMPKLRGIEDRSIGKICLDRIQDLLETEGLGSLTSDFRTAREQGYGQFIWSSAKYLSEK